MRLWLRSARFALAGIVHVWRTQRNLRIEGVLGALAVLVTLWLNVSPAPVLLACGLVLGLELMNTAVEAVVDLVSPDFHPLAKVAKDAAAGAVLVACLFALVVGGVVLGPPLLRKLGLL